MIKYRYALDRENNLIDIVDLERTGLTKLDKFFSVDFKQELIPHLGKIKKKHFVHKPNIEIYGSGETYLHALGKKIFFNEYSQCLQNNSPFNLKYTIQRQCNRLYNEFNITCKLKEKTERFDLARYYDKILIEENDDNFIPDLLILNTRTNEKIYIEIAVTHFSSDTKKNSKYRIIEFKLNSEADIQKIINFKNIGSSNIVNFYNFNIRQNSDVFCTEGNCIRKFNLFRVGNDGKCNMLDIKEKDFQKMKDKYKTNSLWCIIEPAEIFSEEEIAFGCERKGEMFTKFVARAYQEKVKVKNCFICRYHARNSSWDFIKGEPIFCKINKKTCDSNNASNCQYYKVEQSYVNNYLQPPSDDNYE